MAFLGKKWRCVAIFATIVTHRLFFWTTDIWQTTWEPTDRASQVPDHLGKVFIFKSSVGLEYFESKIVVIGPIRIGRLFIKPTIVIDIFMIPSWSKRCSPPVQLVFWAGQSHYRTDVTRHTCLSIRLVTVSSTLWQYSQFPLPFENAHNFLGFLRIFKISLLVVWQYSLFRFHFNQIYWLVVIYDINVF